MFQFGGKFLTRAPFFVGALFLNILEIAGRFAVDCFSVQVNRVGGVKWVVEGQLPFCEEK